MTAKALALAIGVTLAAAITPAAAQSVAPAGALSCSGCHPAAGTAGAAVPPIHGRPAADIVSAMADFRGGKRSPTVMDRIAKGFTDDETRAIAAWFAAQR
jgi:sulfide dehydrogenase cytochrome subunit